MGARQTAAPSTIEVLAIWTEYRRTGEPRLRDRLIFLFTPMARYIAYRKIRMMPQHCDVDDFVSCALEALIYSIDRYDPSRGTTLEQYAWRRIDGAVLDELRRQDWAPRSVRRDERAINGARDRFRCTHDRRPSVQELADGVGMTPVQLTDRLAQVARAEVDSLNRTARSDESVMTERIDTLESADRGCDPLAQAEVREAKRHFRTAFARLSRREREVAVMLYVHEWTLREIGLRLGISESRVSQIHTQLRGRLAAQLSSETAMLADLN